MALFLARTAYPAARHSVDVLSLSISYKHIPLLLQPCCELDLAETITITLLSPISPLNLSMATVLLQFQSELAESHLSLVIYLFQTPVLSDELRAAAKLHWQGCGKKHWSFQYTQLNVLWEDWSNLLTVSCSPKLHFPHVVHMLFLSICWLECGDEGQSIYSFRGAWEVLDWTSLSLPCGGKIFFHHSCSWVDV